MVEIKSTCCGDVICSGDSLTHALMSAVRDGVSLRYADLRNRYCSYLDLPGIDLSYADLRGAGFRYANLRGANLELAKVDRADFRGANLEDVCHTGVEFSELQIRYAKTRGMWADEVSVPVGFETVAVGSGF